MYSKLAVLVASTFALSAVAAPGGPPGNGGGITNSCNVGTLNCCNSVQDSSSGIVQTLAGLLGIGLGSLTAQVGLTCNPISVIGVGGNSCSAQPACCSGNNFSGLITLACSPLNINL